MKRIAFLFPGQGAQYSGMGKDFYQHFSLAKETFQEADETLGRSLSKIIFEGSEEELTKTNNSQLAILVVSIALTRVLQQQSPSLIPWVCSGLSLGEYSALYAAGKLPFRDTLLLVRERARAMTIACEKSLGTMAAVLGLTASEVEETLQGVAEVWIANYNAPGQVVISGTPAGIERGSSLLKAKGAKRIISLQVQGAFHSGLMHSAEVEFAPFVARAPLVSTTEINLVMNASGDFVSSLEELRRLLISQVTHSVRWEQGIVSMAKQGVELYLEIGCGKTLSGLNRKIVPASSTISLEKLADLEPLMQQLEKSVLCKC